MSRTRAEYSGSTGSAPKRYIHHPGSGKIRFPTAGGTEARGKTDRIPLLEFLDIT